MIANLLAWAAQSMILVAVGRHHARSAASPFRPRAVDRVAGRPLRNARASVSTALKASGDRPRRSQVDARLAPYRNAPFTADLMLRIKADIAALDPKIESHWMEESPQSVFCVVRLQHRTEGHRAPACSMDTSRVPEPLCSQVETQVNSFVNAPFTEDLVRRMQLRTIPGWG